MSSLRSLPSTLRGALAAVLSAALVAGLASLVPGAAQAAGPYDAVYVFGDSLSDNGNFFNLSGGTFPPAPYFSGRFSNGPVAVEGLASGLGVPLFDRAIGGATTGLFNGNFAPQHPLGGTGLLSQLSGYAKGLGGAPADANALYVVWAGPNDFLHPTSLSPQATAAIAVSNLTQTVQALYDMGARHFLLPLMPDLGLTPRLLASGPGASAQATALSQQFNTLLGAAYGQFGSGAPSATLSIFNTFQLQHQIISNPSSFGLSVVDTACITVLACVASPAVADTYLFWDDIHPTTRAHQIFAQQMLAQVVPEPHSAWLLGAGLVVLLARARPARGRRPA